MGEAEVVLFPFHETALCSCFLVVLLISLHVGSSHFGMLTDTEGGLLVRL